MSYALLIAAGMFAVVAGANDGSSVLSAGLGPSGTRPLVSLGVFLVALVIGPWLVFGTGVATTLAHGLVPFSGPDTDRFVLVATISAMMVVFALVRAGLPTSLTLALVGAIAGAGLGAGLPLRGGELAMILLVGLAAPLVSAALALALSPLALRLSAGARAEGTLLRWHRGAFVLQCLAYSANGGQKMLALFAVAAGTASGGVVRDPWYLALSLPLLFGMGVLLGIRNISARLGRGILAVRLRHAAVAETCSFAVVMGAGLAGIPLTMSQSVAGALVGAGLSESRTRVRWREVTRMAGAWGVTLPASVAVAAIAGLAARAA
ncbi:inorganic phosphate transporter [Conexibacter sp. S30A1]|uniref:inorganic phosphate transporter n=1 Tax=Conexibacter sp. S30A1 TaxID=2937800 RepID=UPI00200E19BB|nr:inorganic phosphate transporter [Conexibacter sp. S30A1]